jgi:enoyl-CoA hydratase/carnithine racemase
MDDDPLASQVLVQRAGAALRVTFNRPECLNALTTGMLARAAQAITAAGSDPGVRVVVLTGAGQAFSSGADLAVDADGQSAGLDTVDAANGLIRAVREVPRPVLAAVNGPAAGVGCSIALAADLTVAGESAYFLLAFTRVGLMLDGGATALVPAAVGHARASRMALLAEPVPARLADAWGLVSHVVSDDGFHAEVERLTTHLAHGPTAAYAWTKRALNATSLAHLERGLAIERDGQAHLFVSDDFAAGAAAFREKRPPEFTGR